MLKSLQIKNYALIENIYVEFGNGLNIITGETGAGKSILIGAMGLLLGERASSQIVRKGANKAVIEGIFDVKNNKSVEKVLHNYNLDFEDDLIIRREIPVKGSARNFINDTPVNLSQIKEIGNILVDLHGQHDHQSLLKTEEQLKVLDEFGDYSNLLSRFSSLYLKFKQKQNELLELLSKEETLKQKSEFYSFQLSEIEKINPQLNEDIELENELKILENSEKFLSNSKLIYQKLYEEENSVHDALTEIKRLIDELAEVDASFNKQNEELNSIIVTVDDLSSFFREYYQNLDLDTENVEHLRQRLGQLNLLKKKYGSSINSILNYKKKISEEIELSENYEEKINGIKSDIEKLRAELSGIGEKISEKRKKSALEVKKGVEAGLKKLGIVNSIFEIVFSRSKAGTNDENFVTINNEKIKITSKGIDEIEFYISTNLGEEIKPLSKVASGGEISRIMLALKSVLAKTDKLPLLIFDEIDTGVSGRIAQKVGKAMKSLASFHQLIAITHLPQIAGLADHHYLVEKKQVDNRVISNLYKLNNEERVNEVAKLMSGEEITEINLQSAKTLMQK